MRKAVGIMVVVDGTMLNQQLSPMADCVGSLRFFVKEVPRQKDALN